MPQTRPQERSLQERFTSLRDVLPRVETATESRLTTRGRWLGNIVNQPPEKPQQEIQLRSPMLATSHQYMSGIVSALQTVAEKIDTPEELQAIAEDIQRTFSILNALQTKVQALVGVFRRCCHEQGSSPVASGHQSPKPEDDRKES